MRKIKLNLAHIPLHKHLKTHFKFRFHVSIILLLHNRLLTPRNKKLVLIHICNNRIHVLPRHPHEQLALMIIHTIPIITSCRTIIRPPPWQLKRRHLPERTTLQCLTNSMGTTVHPTATTTTTTAATGTMMDIIVTIVTIYTPIQRLRDTGLQPRHSTRQHTECLALLTTSRQKHHPTINLLHTILILRIMMALRPPNHNNVCKKEQKKAPKYLD
mmetsp:Transcript_11388/g.22729  ORF Transcript_11388/g.22729 Transcript_11388/m.22729 type:complete len:215 (+) Transcript_11388:2622-3266(+)